MSKVRPSYFVQAYHLFRDQIKRRVVSNREKLVGKDETGRLYFEREVPGHKRPLQRFFRSTTFNTPVDPIEEPVPPAWDQWLRQTRKDPPLKENVLTKEEAEKIGNSIKK